MRKLHSSLLSLLIACAPAARADMLQLPAPPATNVVTWTTPGTYSYTPTSGAKAVKFWLLGAAGGAGSGGISATGVACSGGGGGGAGSLLVGEFQVSSLPGYPSFATPLSVVVGAGGTGGAGVTGTGATAGANGAAGGDTYIWNGATYVLKAWHGGAGSGGNSNVASGGGGGASIGGAGGNASAGTGGSAGSGNGVAGGSGAAGPSNLGATI